MEAGIRAEKALKRYQILTVAAWSVLIGGSFAWNWQQESRSVMESARAEGRSNLDRDSAYRSWLVEQGGIYVRPTPRIPQDPYLVHPRKNVVTTEGDALTLLNPAFVLREVQKNQADPARGHSRVVALHPLNPKNAADDWEREGLDGLSSGIERSERVEAPAGPQLRAMRPFFVSSPCLACHAGFKAGDIAGAISTVVPLAPYLDISGRAKRGFAVSHGLIWLAGLTGIVFAFRRTRRYLAAEREWAASVAGLNAELEQRVAARTEELTRALREIESFSYSVSHDLRAPLRALNGYAHLLKESQAEKLSREDLHLLDRIAHNAEKMGQLIDDILEYSRTARRAMYPVPVALAPLVAELVAEQAEHYPAARFDIAPLPSVEGDPVMLRQVFSNLIGNALKFSSGCAEPRIGIGAEATDGMLLCHVRDNGTGFDMAYAEKLFSLFQRLHRESEFPGTGVGLAIVKRIIERHGGRIWAEAAPDAGATFHFTLPLHHRSP